MIDTKVAHMHLASEILVVELIRSLKSTGPKELEGCTVAICPLVEPSLALVLESVVVSVPKTSLVNTEFPAFLGHDSNLESVAVSMSKAAISKPSLVNAGLSISSGHNSNPPAPRRSTCQAHCQSS